MALAIVARVVSDILPARTDSAGGGLEIRTPGIRPLAIASASFMRFTSAPVLTHASAVSLYPVGGWH